eukprot:CAMPEP_0180766994 /NCGR_PEP_ID=MMETSP1038_2-20121128/39785_1 /TAXON_ID=632150 /ORGANISM="Azadinium spinosum, Strain 3D9" /LENGTH=187 /DNA_ID=CAMNT_0022801529 /DNA_START=50 /DNA_END=610 /DNA_ORIENTATION=-
MLGWASVVAKRCLTQSSTLPAFAAARAVQPPFAVLAPPGPRAILPLPNIPTALPSFDGYAHWPAEVVGSSCPGGRSSYLELPEPSEESAPVEAPPSASSGGAPLHCLRVARRRRKSQGLEERWWLEYDPPKANYISGFGRGPHGGNSIPKADWPRQMIPIHYKKNWERRERLRYAFRKNGFELDVPK